MKVFIKKQLQSSINALTNFYQTYHYSSGWIMSDIREMPLRSFATMNNVQYSANLGNGISSLTDNTGINWIQTWSLGSSLALSLLPIVNPSGTTTTYTMYAGSNNGIYVYNRNSWIKISSDVSFLPFQTPGFPDTAYAYFCRTQDALYFLVNNGSGIGYVYQTPLT